jgi:hypothetical protein
MDILIPLIIFFALLIISSLCMCEIRIERLTAWKSTAIMAVLSIIGGCIYSFFRGTGIIGAMCMGTLLVVPFSVCTLVWGKALEKKQHNSR